jgi:hypothetical protein
LGFELTSEAIMRTMARVGAALALSMATAAVAADQYALREDAPVIGTNIVRAAVVWPVPINRRYEELSSEQRHIVRDDYVTLASGDEPPYPAEGMAAVLREVAKIQSQEMASGLLHLAVRVDASGHPRGIAVLASPSQAIEQSVAIALLDAAYKPGKCDGKPCDSDFSFKYRFELDRHHTSRAYWNPVMWAPAGGVHY